MTIMAITPFTLALVFAPLLCLAVSVNYPLEDQLPQIARVGQPFSWSFSPITFDDDSAGPLQYTAYSIPTWLSFNPATRTFSGTPGPNDEGRPQIRVEAEDQDGDTDDSVLTLCVTSYSPPVLNRPIAQQFVEGNPSLSSVFLLSQNSALGQDPNVPTLRVPSSWSFSIGFEYDTFNNKSNVYYDARQADGSPLPSWMRFSTKGITVDGVVPHEDVLATPATFYLALHASDQEGFTAETLPFNLVIASHELSLGPGMSSLPTINVTAGEDFDVALASSLDYNGALFDGSQIQPDSVTIFDVDTSSVPGLAYDKVTHRLKGKAPSNTTTLPVSLEANGQTLNSTLQIMSVPSFFTHDNLGGAETEEGGKLTFDLEPFLTDKGISEDVDLSISLSPVEAGSWLSFSNTSRILSGTAPKSDPGYESVGVTFTAYSHDTHSTSHARLSVALDDVGPKGKGESHGATSEKRGKIVSILTIVFGILGGMLGLGLLIAALSKCARNPDTALGPEQALQSFSEKEKSYYDYSREGDAETGHSRVGESQSRVGSQSDMSLSNSYVHPSMDLPQPPQPVYAAARYNNIGQGYPLDSPASSMMTKANFMDRVRTAARNVSDKARRVSGRRPAISRPMPVRPDPEQGTPTLEPIGGPAFFGDPGSDADSPALTGGTATPIIVPRNTPASAGFDARRIRDSRGETLSQVRRSSSGSVNSLASLRTHEETATVHKAQRATSIRNMGSPARNLDPDARLMPGPSTRGTHAPFSPTQNGLLTGKLSTRPISQVASVQDAQADELETSMAYIKAYNGRPESSSTKRASTAYTTMSFSAGESPSMSSSRAESRAGGGRVDKVVSPGGQMVVTLRLTPEGARAQERNTLRVHQVDGEKTPDFIRAELKARPGHPGEVVIRAMPPLDCSEELVAVAVYDSRNNIVSNEVRFEISQEI